MNVTPRHALGSSSATLPGNTSHEASTSRRSSEDSDDSIPCEPSRPSQPPPLHRLPAASNAQLLAGMNPATTSRLPEALRSVLPSSSPPFAGISVGSGDTRREEEMHLERMGSFPDEAASDAAPPSTERGELATSAAVLRAVYNEKLQASIRSIVETLHSELPQDHIFQQLLADPTTQQYCKVRMAEVVEGFLYSTQAEQYHVMATELARREQDCVVQQHRIEALELAFRIERARAEAVQARTPFHQASNDTDNGDHYQQQNMPSEAAVTTASVSAAAQGTQMTDNPMDNEEARHELLRILEETAHDQELYRCTEAVQAVETVVSISAKAATTTAQQQQLIDKYLYEAELQEALYRCVHTLLHYVDGALESQERLRHDLQRPSQSWCAGAASSHSSEDDSHGKLDGVAMINGFSGLAPPASATKLKGGDVVSSRYSTPSHPRASLDNGDCGPLLVSSSAVSSHISFASAPASSAQSQQIQHQRERLRHLAEQLENGHMHSRQILDELAHMDSARRCEIAKMEALVKEVQEDAAVARNAADAAQQTKEREDRVRAELAASAAGERTELRDQLADAKAKLEAAQQDVQTARQEVQSLTNRVTETEERERTLAAEVSKHQATLALREDGLRELHASRTALQAELTTLKATLLLATDQVQDAAREVLCLRVEKTVARLTAIYQEAKYAKLEMLEREGYRPLCHTFAVAMVAQQEVSLAAQARTQESETMQWEWKAVQRSCTDALEELLRCMWADDAIDAVMALSPHTEKSGVADEKDAITAASQQEEPVMLRDSRNRDASSVFKTSHGTAASSLRTRNGPLPGTLQDVCAQLEQIYQTLREHHHARQQKVDALQAALTRKDIELQAAQVSEARLRDLLKSEQVKETQWKEELTQLGEHNPMRGLLAREEALVKAVSDERNELRQRWNRLSSDYIALERRNGVLHARCAAKERENARLRGMVQRGGSGGGSDRGSTTREDGQTLSEAGRDAASIAARGGPLLVSSSDHALSQAA